MFTATTKKNSLRSMYKMMVYFNFIKKKLLDLLTAGSNGKNTQARKLFHYIEFEFKLLFFKENCKLLNEQVKERERKISQKTK